MSFEPVDVTQPLPRKLDIPIIDMHCHTRGQRNSALMIKAARRFGVVKLVAICRLHEVADLKKWFGDLLAYNVWLDYSARKNPPRFADTNVKLVRDAAQAGVRCVKFWYKPQFNAEFGFYFDDWRLDPIFQAMVEHGLPALVHIADPDIWWKSHYHDPQRYETKAFTYRQLTNTLGRYPDMKVLAPHMGGHPEHLDHLSEMLETYPNFHLDTSGTKWVARELSAQPQKARDFFIRWADRMMFGSDLVAFNHADLWHHCSRYWVHQFMYEQDGVVRSPIEDADAGGPVYLSGLDLPEGVLRRLYRDNAVEFFRLDV